MGKVHLGIYPFVSYFVHSIFLEFAYSQNIAIDVARKTIIHTEEDLVITCSLRQYNELLKVDSIRLLRNNSQGMEETMATLTDGQRPTPTNLPGVTVRGSLRPLWSAKLSFTLGRDFVDCQSDRAGYMCALTGMDQNFIPVQQFTGQVPVSIAVKCNKQQTDSTSCVYKEKENAVVVIGITVAIVIVVIGAGVNFAVWKRYHNVLENHMKHTNRRQNQLEKQEFDATLKREGIHYTDLDLPEQEQNTYDVLHPYIEPVSHGH